jgi:hypothetical protein
MVMSTNTIPPIVGIIGSHLDITSVRREHQAKWDQSATRLQNDLGKLEMAMHFAQLFVVFDRMVLISILTARPSAD